MGLSPLLETSDRDSIPGTGVWPQQFPFHLHLAACGRGSLDHDVSACSASKPCLLRELAGVVPSPPAQHWDPGWELFAGDGAGTLLPCRYKFLLSVSALLMGWHLPTSRRVSLHRGGSHELPSRGGWSRCKVEMVKAQPEL